MTKRLPALAAALAAAALLFAGPAADSLACPFCAAPSLTLSEQASVADALVLVEWAAGKKGDKEKPGSTTYEIVQVAKGPGKMGERLTLDRYRPGKEGDLFMILGSAVEKSGKLEWGSPFEVTETSFNYVKQAPPPESPVTKRLEYFVKFLEFSDPTISNDAFAEFANAQYKDVVAIRENLPRDKLRQWISAKDTPATRVGLYGMMLGLCGDETDAKRLEDKFLEKSEDFRLGIDGVMGGYLLLKGADGLPAVEQSKLLDKTVPFSETFAAMQALRFMWQYGDGRISPERLQAAMRLLLDRPELADLVIADLSRWRDWTVQAKLRELYGTEGYNIPSIKRAIVRYMLSSVRDVPKNLEGDPPAHAVNGKKYLEELRKLDPKTVSEAERFFLGA